MRHYTWISTVGYYLGMAALVHLAFTGPAEWWFAVVGLYFVGSLTITAGYHRLFCHASYKTHAFWHLFFALAGVLFLYGSPLQWIVTHFTHHEHSDTARDPHPNPKTAFFSKAYRPVELDLMSARRLLRQNAWHMWLDGNYMLVWFLAVNVMALISLDLLFKVYLPALGLAHFVGASHNVLSHWGGKPRDLWWMEYLLPASGEWLHKSHHEQPRLWNLVSKWYHLDFGALMIRAIRKQG
jgi:stearoyl-CoA desaturase (delta-9 desaturase)